MSSFLSTQPYKGTRDFYPEDMRLRNWMFSQVRSTVEGYGYGEYGGPMLEPFELYAAKTGEEIVNQQLYWMMDRGERKVAIRPEMTPTLARLVAGRFQELPRPVRLYCFPNFMRYERPQRGRLREFWQLNVDVLGGDPTLADAEVIAVSLDILAVFGGKAHAAVKVNNRRLMDQLFKDEMGLDADAASKLGKLIDARDKLGPETFEKLISELGMSADRRQRLDSFYKSSFGEISKSFAGAGTKELGDLFQALQEMGLGDRVSFDASILRGLDYYTGTVFEVFDVSPENRRAMFGGGRYDNLLGLFGKNQLSGVGFGMGDVTLQNFIETHKLVPAKLAGGVEVSIGAPKRELLPVSEAIARELRAQGLRVSSSLSFEGFGAQLKAASKQGAAYAVLLGDEELKRDEVLVKDLASGAQESVAKAGLAAWLRERLLKNQTA